MTKAPGPRLLSRSQGEGAGQDVVTCQKNIPPPITYFDSDAPCTPCYLMTGINTDPLSPNPGSLHPRHPHLHCPIPDAFPPSRQIISLDCTAPLRRTYPNQGHFSSSQMTAKVFRDTQWHRVKSFVALRSGRTPRQCQQKEPLKDWC